MILAARGTQPVEVVGYDPDWPRAFAEERDRVAAAIGEAIVAIEHVGRTAFPACRPSR